MWNLVYCETKTPRCHQLGELVTLLKSEEVSYCGDFSIFETSAQKLWCKSTTQFLSNSWIFNSDKICRSYSDLNFGVTFLGLFVNNFLLAIQVRTSANLVSHNLRHRKQDIKFWKVKVKVGGEVCALRSPSSFVYVWCQHRQTAIAKCRKLGIFALPYRVHTKVLVMLHENVTDVAW